MFRYFYPAWWGESGARPNMKKPGPMSHRRPQGLSSHIGIHGNVPFVLPSRDVVVAYGGQQGREVLSGGRRSGGLPHGEVKQGRGGEELTTPRSRGQKSGEKKRGGGGGGGRATVLLGTAADECRNKTVDRSAKVPVRQTERK